MNAFLRAATEIADRGSRTLSADAALLSTRQADETQLGWREKALFWDINERIHYYFEDMRRVRVSLAPPFGSQVCILH